MANRDVLCCCINIELWRSGDFFLWDYDRTRMVGNGWEIKTDLNSLLDVVCGLQVTVDDDGRYIARLAAADNAADVASAIIVVYYYMNQNVPRMA